MTSKVGAICRTSTEGIPYQKDGSLVIINRPRITDETPPYVRVVIEVCAEYFDDTVKLQAKIGGTEADAVDAIWRVFGLSSFSGIGAKP